MPAWLVAATVARLTGDVMLAGVSPLTRPKNVAVIREWLDRHDVHLAGRYSEWEYYNSDHAFLAGRKAAERAKARLAGRVAAG